MKASFKVSSIILSVCEAAVGILLLVNPLGFTTGIIIFLGIVLCILGIANVVEYFRAIPEVATVKQGFTRGCVEIMVGLFCILKNGWIVSVFPILTIMYGIVILLTGIMKVQWSIDKIRLKIKKWIWTALSAVLTIVCALIILCNPFSSTAVLWIFIAVLLIVEAVIDLIAAILSKEGKND